MAGHLKADLARIGQVSRALAGLRDEFANLTRIPDVGAAAGDPGLASALRDFATDWSDKRTALTGQMHPGQLAALGKHMADAAAQIEHLAAVLPQICASEVWDSKAGQEFRRKAAGTAAGIGRTHHRFITVAAALGRHPAGSTGYAARLQAHQDAADAPVNAVNGTAANAGSEAERRSAWTLLLDAAGGADPAQPPAAHGAKPPPAGPMPLPAPGRIPAYLPAFAADNADVARLKDKYNAAIGQLHASAQAISAAVAGRSADAQAAAMMIRTAGVIASVCGIIALVLAFIPGLQAFAAMFETVALLAQAVAFACHAVLLLGGHGSWLDLSIDAVGLVTFGIGKGLIGGAEATAGISEAAASSYRAVAGAGSKATGSCSGSARAPAWVPT